MSPAQDNPSLHGSTFKARFPALASRSFAVFLVGQFVSFIGSWVQTTAQSYLAYRISGEPVYLGVIGAAATLPALLFTLPGGVWVERLDKRRALIVLQAVMMCQALLLAGLTFAGVVTVWWITGLAFVLGTVSSLELTARQSILSELAGREAIASAIALQSMAFNVARVLGPSLAALLLVALGDAGPGGAFVFNAASYLFVMLSLLSVRSREVTEPTTHAPALIEFREGQAFVWHNALLSALVVMAAATGLVGFPVIQQFPVFARDVLSQVNDTEATIAARNSLLVGAQGVGALLASVALTLLSQTRRKGLVLLVGQLIFAVALAGLSLSRDLLLSVACTALLGCGIVTMLATSNTVIQLVTPRALRGRVISTYLWALQGTAPLGSLLVGGLAQQLGAPMGLLICGAVFLLTIAVAHVRAPAVRQFAAQQAPA